MTSNISLTICSTYVPNDRPKFLPNIDLVNELNKSGVRWSWVVVDNSDDNADGMKFETDDPRFTILNGPSRREKYKPEFRGSYHHAEGLNLARTTIKYQRNHYLLILDPDFFIIRPNWIEETLTYMRENDLAFLGAPWHPRWALKPRDFPCLHCLFIDLGKVWIKSINFFPEVLERRREWFPKNNAPAIQKIKYHPLDTSVFFVGRVIRKLMQAGSRDTAAIEAWLKAWQLTRYFRCQVGTLRDTGIKLAKDFGGNSDLKTELLTPVVSFENGFDKSPHIRSAWGRRYEALFDPSHSYLPRSGMKYSEKSFADFSLPDIQGQGWEEFQHNGKPFGFHIRSYFWDNSPDAPPPDVLQANIRSFLSEIKLRQI